METWKFHDLTHREPELLERVARGHHEYRTWGRATLGWSLYLFRR